MAMSREMEDQLFPTEPITDATRAQAGYRNALRETNEDLRRNLHTTMRSNSMNRETIKSMNSLVAAQKGSMRAANFWATAQIAAITGVAVGLKKLTIDSAMTAVKYEANVNRMRTSMGQVGDDVLAWGDANAAALGMSKAEFASMGATLSTFFKSFSGDATVNAGLVRVYSKSIAIMAANVGMSIEEATQRVKSGLLGQSEAIDNLGIELKVSALEGTKAFKMLAGDKSWQQLDNKTQNIIRTLAILEQAKDRFGSSMPTTTASAIAMVSAEFSNAALAVGQAFLPVLQVTLPWVRALGASLTWAAEQAKYFSQVLFGTTGADDKARAAALGQFEANEKLAKGIGKVADAKKKAAQSFGFDELNTISKDPSEDPTGAGPDISGMAGATAIEPVIKPIIDLSGYEKTVGILKGILKPLGDIDLSAITNAFKPLNDINWTPMIDGLTALTGGFSSLMTSISNNILGPFVSEFITPLAEKLAEDTIPKTLTALGNIMGELGKIFEIMKPSLTAVFQVFSKLAGLALDAFVWSLEAIGKGLAELNKYPKLVDFLTKFAIALGVIATVTWLWTVAVSALNIALAILTSPISLVVLAIAAVITIIWLLWDNWDVICIWMMDTMNKVGNWIGEVWDGVKKVVGIVWDAILWKIGGVWDLIMIVFNGVGTFFSKLWEGVKKITSDIWDGMKSLFSTFWNGLKSIANGIGTFFSTIWDGIKTTFKALWDGIVLIFKTWWDLNMKVYLVIWEFIRDYIIAPIATGFSNVWNGIKTSFNNAWTGLKTTLSTLWTYVKDNIIDKIATGFKTAWEGIGSIVTTVWTGIKNTIKDSINGVISLINFFIQKLNTIKIKIPAVDIPGIGMVGGGSVGFSVPEIPKLAKGGIVDSATLAMIGEGKSSEAVIPLNEQGLEPLINGIVNAMTQVLGDLGGTSNGNQPMNISLVLDGETLSKATYKYNQAESNRRSSRLVTVV